MVLLVRLVPVVLLALVLLHLLLLLTPKVEAKAKKKMQATAGEITVSAYLSHVLASHLKKNIKLMASDQMSTASTK